MRIRTSVAAVVALCLPTAVVAQQQVPQPSGSFAQEQDQSQVEQELQQDRPAPPDAASTQPRSRDAQQRESGFRGVQDQPQLDQQGNQQVNEELVNYLATKMYLANQCEIAAASMATDKAQSPEVKNFAQTLVDDHEQIVQQLKQAMPGLNQVQPLSFANTSRSQQGLNQNQQQRSAQPPIGGQSRNAQPTAGTRGSDQFLDGAAQTLVDINRRASETKHQMTKEMLNQKQGKEFDKAFVGLQIAVHTHMLAELKAVRDMGPQQFTSIVQQAEQKTQSHLDQAKQLVKQLDDGQSQGQQSQSRQGQGQQRGGQQGNN